MSACRHWYTSAKSSLAASSSSARRSPWFLAMHTRGSGGGGPACCYVHNPELDRWHSLPLDFVPFQIRLVATVGSLLLCRLAAAGSSSVRLVLCNPFTRQYRALPNLNTPRSNPAIGVVAGLPGPHGGGASSSSSSFRVYVAGGTSSGASYEPTLEMYDAEADDWRDVGPMPVEFAVRLTVWTPNESVYAGGVVYWMTSARAYSLVGFDVGARTWKEVKIPMAERLEWAAPVRRSRTGRLGLVGGTCGGEGCIWELGVGDEEEWVLVAVVVSVEIGRRFWGGGDGGKGTTSWGGSKTATTAAGTTATTTTTIRCVGCDEAVYLYRGLGSEMMVWREVPSDQEGGGGGGGGRKWEWVWVEGCCSTLGLREEEGVPPPPTCSTTVPIKGVILHPSLSPSRL